MVGAALLLGLCPARAENLDAGKSPQALFTGTCSACHASPRGLGKNMSASSMASFLREHYTASPQSAAAIAAYVAAAGPDPRAKEKEQPKGREAKQPEPTGTAAGRHATAPAIEAAKGKQTTAHRPELDERLPQAHGPREALPEEPKKKDRTKKQEARTQEPAATPVAPSTPEPEPTPAPSAAPPAAEPPAVSKAPVETPDQPAFSVPSP